MHDLKLVSFSNTLMATQCEDETIEDKSCDDVSVIVAECCLIDDTTPSASEALTSAIANAQQKDVTVEDKSLALSEVVAVSQSNDSTDSASEDENIQSEISSSVSVTVADGGSTSDDSTALTNAASTAAIILHQEHETVESEGPEVNERAAAGLNDNSTDSTSEFLTLTTKLQQDDGYCAGHQESPDVSYTVADGGTLLNDLLQENTNTGESEAITDDLSDNLTALTPATALQQQNETIEDKDPGSGDIVVVVGISSDSTALESEDATILGKHSISDDSVTLISEVSTLATDTQPKDENIKDKSDNVSVTVCDSLSGDSTALTTGIDFQQKCKTIEGSGPGEASDIVAVGLDDDSKDLASVAITPATDLQQENETSESKSCSVSHTVVVDLSDDSVALASEAATAANEIQQSKGDSYAVIEQSETSTKIDSSTTATDNDDAQEQKSQTPVAAVKRQSTEQQYDPEMLPKRSKQDDLSLATTSAAIELMNTEASKELHDGDIEMLMCNEKVAENEELSIAANANDAQIGQKEISRKFQKKLIKEVQKHITLYDTKCKNFTNIDAKKRAWEEVANVLDTNVEICKETWIDLRYKYQNYVRKLQKFLRSNNVKQKRRPTMNFERDLLFLWHYVSDRSSNSSIASAIESSNTNVVALIPTIQPLQDDVILIDPYIPVIDLENTVYATDDFIVSRELYKLIQLIKEYPELYDVSNRYYHDYNRKGIIWSSIAYELNDKATKIMKLWIYVQTRFEWELFSKAQEKTKLKELMKFLLHATISDANTVYKQSYYLRKCWHDPLNFKFTVQLLAVLPIYDKLIDFNLTKNADEKSITEYKLLWRKVAAAKDLDYATPGQCEVTWLIMRKFYSELLEMRKTTYQLQDNWYFESSIASVYAHESKLKDKRAKRIKNNKNNPPCSYAHSVPIEQILQKSKEKKGSPALSMPNSIPTFTEQFVSTSSVRATTKPVYTTINQTSVTLISKASTSTTTSVQSLPALSPICNKKNIPTVSIPAQLSISVVPKPTATLQSSPPLLSSYIQKIPAVIKPQLYMPSNSTQAPSFPMSNKTNLSYSSTPNFTTSLSTSTSLSPQSIYSIPAVVSTFNKTQPPTLTYRTAPLQTPPFRFSVSPSTHQPTMLSSAPPTSQASSLPLPPLVPAYNMNNRPTLLHQTTPSTLLSMPSLKLKSSLPSTLTVKPVVTAGNMINVPNYNSMLNQTNSTSYSATPFTLQQSTARQPSISTIDQASSCAPVPFVVSTSNNNIPFSTFNQITPVASSQSSATIFSTSSSSSSSSNANSNSAITSTSISSTISTPTEAISKPASQTFPNKMKIELIIGPDKNALIIDSPTKNYIIPMARTALFIRFVMAIPHLHNKELTLTDTTKYWEYISKQFKLPNNFKHFDRIAPIRELMRSFPHTPDIEVWKDGHELCRDLDQIANMKGWNLYINELPALMSEMSQHPDMYINHVVPKIVYVKFPNIYNLEEICFAFKDAFVNYMIDLENGILHKWPQKWWRVLVQLAFLVRIRYNDQQPFYYIVKNKIYEEIERCTKVEKIKEKIYATNTTKIIQPLKVLKLSGRDFDGYMLTYHMRQNAYTYLKCTKADKRKAWRQVANKMFISVDDCFHIFRRALKDFFCYEKRDQKRRCLLNNSYYKHLSYIYDNFKRQRKISTVVESEIILPERYISDINMDNASTRLVMKNWSYAIQNLPVEEQKNKRAALQILFRKYKLEAAAGISNNVT